MLDAMVTTYFTGEQEPFQPLGYINKDVSIFKTSVRATRSTQLEPAGS